MKFRHELVEQFGFFLKLQTFSSYIWEFIEDWQRKRGWKMANSDILKKQEGKEEREEW